MRRIEVRPGDRSRGGLLLTGAAACVLALLLLPAGLSAQSSSDFLFRSPTVTLGVYGGYAVPGADSEIFDFTTERLTVERGDFRSVALGGRLSIRVDERLDLALDVSHAGTEQRSEFRDWVDQDDRPIEQTTSFSRTPVTLNVEVYPWERGRSIGRFVWIPRSVSPYVGAGGGILWYDFRQEGDFVDVDTRDIFTDAFVSDDQTLAGQLFAGVDVSLGPRFFVSGEVRHVWASADMEDDFVGFDRIDLSGFQTTVGVSVRL